MNIYELRQLIGREIVDYTMLLSALSEYSHPRGKISMWLASGDLVRIKKGLYVFGPKASQGSYPLEVLANLIYGPSAISSYYALSYYGLIPERVHTVSSITNKRDKQFSTPVGEFTYHYLNPAKYAIGINLLEAANKDHFLIAAPEKALCDLIALEIKNIQFFSKEEVDHFLFDDLRMEKEALLKFDGNLMLEISDVYCNKRLKQFVKQYLKWVQNNA